MVIWHLFQLPQPYMLYSISNARRRLLGLKTFDCKAHQSCSSFLAATSNSWSGDMKIETMHQLPAQSKL